MILNDARLETGRCPVRPCVETELERIDGHESEPKHA